MAVVSAFGILNGTQNAGMTAYYRAPDCNSVTIADVLPILSKIDYYEDEYVIGEMLIWDSGSQSGGADNCAMVRVIVYNDGWICAWFDKTDQNQIALGGAQYVSATTLSGWGASLGYEDKYNNCILKITSSIDPNCPVNAVFPIQNTDQVNGRITVYTNQASSYTFHTGFSYGCDIYMSNGNIGWYGRTSSGTAYPPNESNRLYRAIYQMWYKIKDSSNSSNYIVGNASLVYMYDNDVDTYTNETTDFNDGGVGDCQVFPTTEEINDAFYIGNADKFSGVSITMGTPGVGTGVTWEYWDGSAWSTLSTTDGTAGFTATGELTFDPPDDWAKTIVVASSYYWIRARVTTASYTTTPLLTQGQLYEQVDLIYTDIELGLYNFEFTGANYLLLCGKYSGVGTGMTVYSYFYTTVLSGKTIYDIHLHCGRSERYSGYGQFTINGVLMYYLSSTHSNGFPVFDISDQAYAAGTQNVCYVRTYGSNHLNEYSRSQAMIIVLVS